MGWKEDINVMYYLLERPMRMLLVHSDLSISIPVGMA